MKKILALLFSLVILMSFPVEAFAAEAKTKEQRIQNIINNYEQYYNVKAQYIDGWIVAKVKDCPNDYVGYYLEKKLVVNDDLIVLNKCDDNEKDLKIPSKIGGYNVAVLATSFSAMTAKSLYIPKNIISIVGADFFYTNGDESFMGVSSRIGGQKLEKITVSKDNKYYSSKSGVLYNKKGTELIAYPSARKGEKFTIPETVVDVSYGAFANRNIKYLKTLVVTKNVNRFYLSDLPNSITKIYFENLKLNKKSIKVDEDDYYRQAVPNNVTIYCFKNSGVHKFLKEYKYKNKIKFLAKPKAPKKAVVKSAKWKKGVKLSIKKQNCSYFRVYRYNKSSGKYKYIGYTKSTSFTDKTAKKGKTYKYKVSAVNKKNGLKKAGTKSSVFVVKTKNLK